MRISDWSSDVCSSDLQPLEVFAIRREILADGGLRDRVAAEQLEVVGDVARAAAELAPHPRHQERDVEDVPLVREDVVLELVGEPHAGVVGQGATDQGRTSSEQSGVGKGWGSKIRSRC